MDAKQNVLRILKYTTTMLGKRRVFLNISDPCVTVVHKATLVKIWCAPFPHPFKGSNNILVEALSPFPCNQA